MFLFLILPEIHVFIAMNVVFLAKNLYIYQHITNKCDFMLQIF